MDNSINTPERLEVLLKEHEFSELDKTPSYVVKAYYDDINMLKEHYGFSLRRILDSINKSLDLIGDDKISYQAFRSALRRVSAKRNSLEGKPSMLVDSGENNKIRAHEKAQEQTPTKKETELSNEWHELLKDHPVMKLATIQKAIDNGLTYEKAKEANEQGIRRFAEVVNKYHSKNLK